MSLDMGLRCIEFDVEVCVAAMRTEKSQRNVPKTDFVYFTLIFLLIPIGTTYIS